MTPWIWLFGFKVLDDARLGNDAVPELAMHRARLSLSGNFDPGMINTILSPNIFAGE